MYSKNMSMRTIIFFTIVVVTGSTMSGDNNYCEQCCEYLENCCKKGEGNKKKDEENKEEEGKGEVKEEFYLKKSEATDSKEIEKLVSSNWYNNREKGTSFFLYEKIDGAGNQDLNNNDGIQVTKDKNGFSFDKDFIPEKGNTKKWALFEIIYKEEEKEKETKYLYCSDIESIGNFGIFSNCQQHSSISVIACDTSGVTDMSDMFYDCSSLTKLNLSKFDTKNVTDMSNMFSYCSSLTGLDLSKFNTETVTGMSGMFCGCSFLKELNLSKFDTKNVTNMSNMFSHCSSLKELDLSKFDTKKVTKMSFMFYKCSFLTKLDLTNFNTGNVKKMGNIFFECSSLQTVTFNKNLNQGIKEQLNKLGLTESEEEGNKITLKKK